ncbi:hypothetical protein D9M71_463240 [compost metagenome]
MTGSHHGAKVGRAAASSTAVTSALPSFSAWLSDWLRSASSNASHSSAALAHSNRFSIMPQPCSQNSASSPGVQASKTRPMLVRRRGSGLLIGQTFR